MICNDAMLLLHAYLDDELDAAQSVAIARHMQTCTACMAAYASHAELRQALAQTQASLYRRAPEALRARWSAPKSLASSVPPATRAPRRAMLALAMAAGFAGALVIATPAWIYTLHRRDAEVSPMVDEAISSHIRSMQVQHLMDVVSTDQHTVKPWFDGKLNFSPRVQDLASVGFPLIGGRLDALGGHSVAALVYRRHLHVINLYQWPARSGTSAPDTVSRNGYTVIRWTADDMRYVAVSSVDPDELQQFVRAFRSAAVTPVTHSD